MNGAVDVAITGVACLFPKAPDAATFWANIAAGVDAITDAPPSRLDPVFHDPTSHAVDRFPIRRGGFVDAYALFEPSRYGVMPIAAEGAEPDQLLALALASHALDDAGFASGPPRESTAVLIGRGNYVGAGTTRLEQHVRTAEQLVRTLRELVPDAPPDRLAEVKAAFQSRLGRYGPDTAIGLVPNLTASRIANRLDLHGPAYTIDAACASGLVAVDQAVLELTVGRVDAALVGGIHLSHDVSFWSVFTQLGALSRAGRIRPFDRAADGVLIGEGVGMLVLERTADALRRGARIYARIRGTGTASDGRAKSLMTPDVAGQLLALKRAWAMSGLDPSTLGLLEAHGTGTPAGDAAELTSAAQFFPDVAAPVIGSVKSMIGHAMPAAGIAGLIKAALAVYSGMLPPTLHVDTPHPLLGRFRTLRAAEPWEGPRVAAVNAFGFGGINAHVVLEGAEPRATAPATRTPAVRRPAAPAAIWVAADTPVAAARALRDGRLGGEGDVRVAIIDPTPERVGRAVQALGKGANARGRDGIFVSQRALLTGRSDVAFLFPGVEATFEPRVDDVAAWLGRPFVLPEAGTSLERQGVGVIQLGRLLRAALERLEIRPAAIAGHSIGEWSGMIASGILPEAAVDPFLEGLRPNSLEVPGVVFVMMGAGAATVRPLLAGLDVVLSHDNCPHQTIACGAEAAGQVLAERCRGARVLAQVLPFRSGFHAPYFAPYAAGPQAYLESLALARGHVPLWSATTVSPYPADEAAIRGLAARHLVEPVRFRELVLALYEHGIRAFVQVGVGSLTAFADDTLRGRDVVATSAAAKERPGLETLARVALGLWTAGADVALHELWPSEATGGVGHAHAAGPQSGADEGRHGAGSRGGLVSRPLTGQPVALGVPLVSLADLAPLRAPSVSSKPARTALEAALQDLERSVLGASREVGDALRRAGPEASPAGPVERRPDARPAAAPPPVPPGSPPPGARVVPPDASAVGASPSPTSSQVRALHLSVEAQPWLLGHSLFPQRPGWPDVTDRYPVVPMTMHIRIMMDAAEARRPGLVAVRVENVRAKTWLAVERPLDLEVTTRLEADGRVAVSLGEYSDGVVVLAERYPDAPRPAHGPLRGPKPSRVKAQDLYNDRYMFHGPGYQSVSQIDTLGEDGIDGEVTAQEGQGSLLDGAGQLFGFHVMEVADRDRLIMPIRIERIEWFGPEPGLADPQRCTVRLARIGAPTVRADLELSRGPHLTCRITGWEDWRFQTDDAVWAVMRRPEWSRLAGIEAVGPETALARVSSAGWGKATTDYLQRRYLGARERAVQEQVAVVGRTAWLLGRVATKDAVRWLFEQAGRREIYPVELAVLPDAVRRPVLTAIGDVPADGIFVSLAHKDDRAVAIASRLGPVGVDIERIEPRSERVLELAFTDAERALVHARDGHDGWLTRLWCAKEAVSKALGTGLGGNPKGFEVDRISGETLWCRGFRVETRVEDNYALAWTLGEPETGSS